MMMVMMFCQGGGAMIHDDGNSGDDVFVQGGGGMIHDDGNSGDDVFVQGGGGSNGWAVYEKQLYPSV